jgi:hypothetical protein
LQIRVVLVGGGPDERRDPGRVFLIGPSHTFGQFAEAIKLGVRALGLVAFA